MSQEQIQADNHFPTIQFQSCTNPKIYVNTIINSPHPHCSSLILANTAVRLNPDDRNPDIKFCNIKPHEGGRVNIYCEAEEEAIRSSLPMISVEIKKLSSEVTSEIKPMPAYVITVNTNNVFGEEAVAVVSETGGHPTINAENVILNSSGSINVGPGAGGHNTGPAAGASNSVTIIEDQGVRIIPIE